MSSEKEDEPESVANEESPLLDSDKKESSSTDGKTSVPADSSEGPELKLPLMYVFFKIHNLACVISLVVMIIAQFLPSPHDLPTIILILLRFYAILACVMGIILELELIEWFVENTFPILDRWLFRGLFYVFLGVFGWEESTYTRDDDDEFLDSFGSGIATILLWISSIGLLVTGTMYSIMGSLFLRRLKRKSQEAFEEMLGNDDDNEESIEIQV